MDETSCMPNRIINPNNKLYKDEQLNRDYQITDISENNIREQMPEIFNILLIDRTTSTADEINNIIWANDNYSQYNHTAYSPSAQIRPELITGNMAKIIMPRALKPREQQKERTKSKAEVFTPIWVVQKQNDILEKEYANDDLDTYIKRKWLEISCGEAPYMVTRYDMNSGQMIPLQKRVGFVDRKLKRINAEINDKKEWQRFAIKAYQASYGFEWNGDSLLLARENLFYTCCDYYFAKWQEEPLYEFLKNVAEVISYNLFQMDALQQIIPLSEQQASLCDNQLTSFSQENNVQQLLKNHGKRVKIMNWDIGEMIFFGEGDR